MKTNTQAITGTLTIGDQWNAITIIAHSQTHPLKAICELTENAIDAGATSVRISRNSSRTSGSRTRWRWRNAPTYPRSSSSWG